MNSFIGWEKNWRLKITKHNTIKSVLPHVMFKACFNWANTAGCILPIAELKDSPWMAEHVWRFSLIEFSSDEWCTGSDSLIYKRTKKSIDYTRYIILMCKISNIYLSLSVFFAGELRSSRAHIVATVNWFHINREIKTGQI